MNIYSSIYSLLHGQYDITLKEFKLGLLKKNVTLEESAQIAYLFDVGILYQTYYNGLSDVCDYLKIDEFETPISFAEIGYIHQELISFCKENKSLSDKISSSLEDISKNNLDSRLSIIKANFIHRYLNSKSSTILRSVGGVSTDIMGIGTRLGEELGKIFGALISNEISDAHYNLVIAYEKSITNFKLDMDDWFHNRFVRAMNIEFSID